MATGVLESGEEDCVALVSSDEELPAEGVLQEAKAKEDEVVVIKNRRASEDDQVKARAVRDHFPKGDDEIELKRGESQQICTLRTVLVYVAKLNCYPLAGDVVEVHSQTLDQLWCEVLNKRSNEEGLVPFEAIEFGQSGSPSLTSRLSFVLLTSLARRR